MTLDTAGATRRSYYPTVAQVNAAVPFTRATSTSSIAPNTFNGPNKFEYAIYGRQPPAIGGSLRTQVKQALRLTNQTIDAMRSVLSHHHKPSDASVRELLGRLRPTPTEGDGRSVTTVIYKSTVPADSADALYRMFVENPNQAFEGTGMQVRPATEQLRTGSRLMLEDHSTPSLWFPVEVELDAKKRSITFHTLDGHPLRGTNKFEFKYGGPGKVQIVQTSDFQASSLLITLGMTFTHALDHQHTFWKGVHDGFYNRVADFGGRRVA